MTLTRWFRAHTRPAARPTARRFPSLELMEGRLAPTAGLAGSINLVVVAQVDSSVAKNQEVGFRTQDWNGPIVTRPPGHPGRSR